MFSLGVEHLLIIHLIIYIFKHLSANYSYQRSLPKSRFHFVARNRKQLYSQFGNRANKISLDLVKPKIRDTLANQRKRPDCDRGWWKTGKEMRIASGFSWKRVCFPSNRQGKVHFLAGKFSLRVENQLVWKATKEEAKEKLCGKCTRNANYLRSRVKRWRIIFIVFIACALMKRLFFHSRYSAPTLYSRYENIFNLETFEKRLLNMDRRSDNGIKSGDMLLLHDDKVSRFGKASLLWPLRLGSCRKIL